MEAGKMINRISNRLRRRSGKAQETIGITGAKGNILNYILLESEKHNVYQKDIEKEFGLRPSTATEVLKNLEEEELIVRIQDEEDGRYERGALCNSEEKEEKQTGNRLAQKATKRPVAMESLKHEIEFRQSNRSADFIAGVDEEESEQRFINRGRLLHTLFSAIRTEADIEDAISRLVFEGVIGRQETEDEIRELTKQAFELPQVKEWYDGTWRLFNECDIIWKENGELRTRRPDRVMMKDGRMVVVDFKFGKPSKKYNRQVKDYMQLLTRMGYDPKQMEGYLWYVTEGRTEKV